MDQIFKRFIKLDKYCKSGEEWNVENRKVNLRISYFQKKTNFAEEGKVQDLKIKMLSRLDEIYSRLQDEESRKIFEAKLEYMINGDRLQFWKSIKKSKKWKIFNEKLVDENYIIYGAGLMGRLILDILKESDKDVLFFVDNDEKKQNTIVDGINVFNVLEIVKYPNIKVITSNRTLTRVAVKQLKSINAGNTIIDESEVCAFWGKQYFDVFSPQEGEIFVDAGCFDGGTVLEFVNWMGEKRYSYIYSFEPDTNNINICRKNIENHAIKNIALINKGTYSKETFLKFSNDGSGGSCFCDNGEINVPVTTVDTVLHEKSATYIKMDVEGSEKETIFGCRKTIKQYHPKMAICIYHKPFDFIELPLFLLDIDADYKFYIRHYASNLCETVLYAE